MSFLDSLRNERQIPTSALLQFLLYHREDPRILVFFLEGIPDKEYIEPAMLQRVPASRVRFIVCNGKRGVLQVLDAVEKRYPNTMSAFFIVDKDFDDLIPIEERRSDRLFTTTGYSVENYLVSGDALRVVLCQLAHFDANDGRVNQLVEKYEFATLAVARVLRRYTACAICAKRQGHNVTLAGINLNKVFTMDESLSLRAHGDIAQRLREMASVAEGLVGINELKAEIRKLRTINYKRWLRGKFELWWKRRRKFEPLAATEN